TDGDGLSDFYEYQNGFDATQADGDCDGLTDYWEAFYDTDPQNADTDHDGLTDGREVFHPNLRYPYENSVFTNANAPACAGAAGLTGGYAGGWSMVYAFNGDTPLHFWVSADPNDADSDDDGLTDRSEQVYGYNPHAPSELDVLALETSISTSRSVGAYVGTGDTIDYAATITNDLSDRYLRGLLESELPADHVIKTQEVDGLLPLASTTLAGSVAVAGAGLSASTATSMTLRSGVIVDALPDHLLWLRLNETAGATTLADSSVFGNDAKGTNITANGQYIYLPTSNATLTAPDIAIPNGVSGLTLAVWFKLTATTTGHTQSLGSIGPGGPIMYVGGDGLLHAFINEGSPKILSSAAVVNANVWHHAAATFDGSNGYLYLDGKLVASGASGPIPSAAQTFNLAGNSSVGFQSYYVDDVELFSTSLDAGTIRNLYSNETLVANLTSTGNGVSCPSDRCPSLSAEGAAFNQTQHLAIDTSNLTFNTNQFSIAIDVQPKTRTYLFNAEAGTHFGVDTSQDWQGVYGYRDPSNDKFIFPSLYVGSQGALRIDMGDGVNSCSYQTGNGIIDFGVEQQVTVSYDGSTFTVYVNGAPQASGAPVACGGVQVPNVSQLYVGRPNNAGYFYWDQVYYKQLSDPGNDNELCLTFDVNSTAAAIWHDYNVADAWETNERYDQLDVSKRITDDAAHWFRFHEDDANTDSCNFNANAGANSDDEFVYKSGLTNATTLGSFQSNFSGCTADCDEGTLYWSLSNEFFVGTLRNLRIYDYALSTLGAERAYNTGTFALQMDLDEAPGATVLVDRSGNYFEAGCAGASCPDSGIPGRW
ncbi:MAG: laminin G domain-containing protein, partial [Caldilineaceae bacterium]|nr:laminin G domain-containing protein [Caldilineaceae bacterium]